MPAPASRMPTERSRMCSVHLLLSALVVIAGLLLGLSTVEWAVIALTIGAVVQAELFNTALEAVVDKASPEQHPLAKAAKDSAAGAVVITVIAAVVVGVLIFGPKLLWFL